MSTALEIRVNNYAALPISDVRTQGVRKFHIPRDAYVYPVRELEDMRNLRTYVIDFWHTKAHENAIALEQYGSGLRVHVSAIDVTRFLKTSGNHFRYTGPGKFGFSDGDQFAYTVSFNLRAGTFSDMCVGRTRHNCELYMFKPNGRDLAEVRARARKEDKRIDEILTLPEVPDEIVDEILAVEENLFGTRTQHVNEMMRFFTRLSKEAMSNFFSQQGVPALHVNYNCGKPSYSLSQREGSQVAWTKPVLDREASAAQWNLSQSLQGKHDFVTPKQLLRIQKTVENKANKEYRKHCRRMERQLGNELEACD